MLAVPQLTYTAKPVYATEATTAKTVGTVTANPSLNLRKTAGTTSAILVSIPKNTQVDVISKNASNWYNVTYSGNTGWVSGSYLTVSSNQVSRGEPTQRIESRVMRVSAYTLSDKGYER